MRLTSCFLPSWLTIMSSSFHSVISYGLNSTYKSQQKKITVATVILLGVFTRLTQDGVAAHQNALPPFMQYRYVF